jgi:hypothetical protein
MAVMEPSPKIIKFPDNKKFLRQNFVSPLCRTQKADINWHTISKNWRQNADKKQLKESLTQTEQKLLDELFLLRMCSSLQLAKYYFPKDKASMTKAKDRLKALAAVGILVRHELKLQKANIPVYTLGPAGALVLDIPYTPNWWKDCSPYKVLRQLITNQLFFRFKLLGYETVYNPTPAPFNGEIIFREMDFRICVTNGKDVPPELKWEKDRRLIIIGESLEELNSTLNTTKNNPNIRYTTDYDLFVTEFIHAFSKYDYESDQLVPTNMPGFTKKE